jgi:hypothetical protein
MSTKTIDGCCCGCPTDLSGCDAMTVAVAFFGACAPMSGTYALADLAGFSYDSPTSPGFSLAGHLYCSDGLWYFSLTYDADFLLALGFCYTQSWLSAGRPSAGGCPPQGAYVMSPSSSPAGCTQCDTPTVELDLAP